MPLVGWSIISQSKGSLYSNLCSYFLISIFSKDLVKTAQNSLIMVDKIRKAVAENCCCYLSAGCPGSSSLILSIHCPVPHFIFLLLLFWWTCRQFYRIFSNLYLVGICKFSNLLRPMLLGEPQYIWLSLFLLLLFVNAFHH